MGGTGYNFGAGMTGGIAFVLDLENKFTKRCNLQLIEIHRIKGFAMASYRRQLKAILREYYKETKNEWGKYLLEDFNKMITNFWFIKPKAMQLRKGINHFIRLNK